MKKVWGVFIIVVLLAIFTGYLYLQTLLVHFNVENNIPGYNFKVSTLAGNLFFYSQGYKSNYKNINIVFTQEEQQGVVLGLRDDDTYTSSMGAVFEGNTLTISEQYSQDALISAMGGEDVKGVAINLDEDIYAYLCLLLDPSKPGRDECYQKADNYLKKLGSFPPIRIINTSKKASYKLVEKVLAACSGTIECGGWETDNYCLNWVKCDPESYLPCSDGSSCIPRTTCDTSLNNLNCSNYTDELSCKSVFSSSVCAVKCNSTEQSCTWGTGGGGGGGGGGCTCNCMSAIAPLCDSSRIGLWNIAFKTGGGNTIPVGESFITTVPNYLPTGLNICADAGSCLCSRVRS